MRLEINKSKRWKTRYVIEMPPQNNIEPTQTLEEILNSFIGCPNNAYTRANIEAALNRWNYMFNDNITINDLNLQ